MSEVTVERVLREVRQLPSLSVVVVEILDSFQNEAMQIPELVRKISRDQALAARVLRVANSAFYGFPSRIGSISEAVVVLGFHAVRSLALAAGIIHQFLPGNGRAFDLLAFWQHAIGVGVCARVVANCRGLPSEEAFTAGLLHDIGRLVLDTYFRDEFQRVLEYRDAHDCTLLAAEKEVLGLDHAAIGYEVAHQWKFPQAIQVAIRDHHSPDGVPAPPTDVIHLANVLAHALEIGNAGYDRVPPLSPAAWERLGGNWEMLESCLPEIERLNAGVNLLVAEGGAQE